MITAFAGSKAAEGFYNNVDWQWGFGCFAIIVPCVTIPLFLMLKYQLRKAENKGIVVGVGSGRTYLQSIWYHIVQFDREYTSHPIWNT